MYWGVGASLIVTLGLALFGSTAGEDILLPGELQQAEMKLEQTAGAKLKDTWPEFRDSLCKDTAGSELNDCRLYQTRLFEQQIALYNKSRNQAEIEQ